MPDQTETPGYTFDFQAEPERSFLKWLLPTVLADVDKEADFQRFETVTKQFTDVTLTMQINGVEVPVQHFLESLERNYERTAHDEAAKLVRSIPRLAELQDVMRRADTALVRELRAELTKAGVELPYEDDEW